MTTSPPIPRPRNVFARYHAHVYFDEKSTEQARELCQSATNSFGVFLFSIQMR